MLNDVEDFRGLSNDGCEGGLSERFYLLLPSVMLMAMMLATGLTLPSLSPLDTRYY